MYFISVIAITEQVAREQAYAMTGYPLETVGRTAFVFKRGNNSRQNAFIFETPHDVTKHPLYVEAWLSEVFDLTGTVVEDGPVLQFGPEVTVGG
jgi:hypothetical protein